MSMITRGRKNSEASLTKETKTKTDTNTAYSQCPYVNINVFFFIFKVSWSAGYSQENRRCSVMFTVSYSIYAFQSDTSSFSK